MKLKLVKTLRSTQSGMVCLTGAGAFKWSKLNEILELPDAAGHEILSKWSLCFEQVKEAEPKAEESPKKKMVKAAPKNKAAIAKEEK